MKSLILVLAVGAAAATMGVAPASASTCSQALIRDWYNDGRIDGTYEVHCYREALKEVPEDQIVYGTLRDDLTRALQNVVGNGPVDPHMKILGKGGNGSSKKKDRGFFAWVADTLGPGSADSIPIPLLVLGGLALLLLAAAGASFLARRIQARRAQPAPATAHSSQRRK